MIVYMFPGQGSQSKGMGGNLFDEFSELTTKANNILGYSIKELCLEDPNNKLNKTEFTQPALYVVNALTYYKKIQETGKKPDVVIGHSLGEFNALLAAGAFSFEDGLNLVKKRGELMGLCDEGAMAAILNSSKEQIEIALDNNGLKNIDLANYNTLSQIVISGATEEIQKAQALFQNDDILYVPLNTSGAFHSRIMEPAKEQFESFLHNVELAELNLPVVSNVTARYYENGSVFDNLAKQISSTVRWFESIEFLISSGSEEHPTTFEEIGYGDVLTKIVAKIQRERPKSTERHLTASDTTTRLDGNSTVATGLETNDASAKTLTSAHQKVSEWNKKYPIGTRVRSMTMDYGTLVTRTEAVVLFGHRAAVYIKDYKGYFDLDEITVD